MNARGRGVNVHSLPNVCGQSFPRLRMRRCLARHARECQIFQACSRAISRASSLRHPMFAAAFQAPPRRPRRPQARRDSYPRLCPQNSRNIKSSYIFRAILIPKNSASSRLGAQKTAKKTPFFPRKSFLSVTFPSGVPHLSTNFFPLVQ